MTQGGSGHGPRTLIWELLGAVEATPPKTLWPRLGWDPLDLGHLRSNFVPCPVTATGVPASAEYSRCRAWEMVVLAHSLRSGLGCLDTRRDGGDRQLVHRAHAPLKGTVAKAVGPPALAGGAGELSILGFHTPPPPVPLCKGFFVSVHSWGLPRQPPLGLPIQNKVSLYLMVMADVRGIWQKPRRGLSLSNISPDVV